MALLNRFSKLNDRAESGVFTFIVTKSVTRDFNRDATTKDFCYGYHRWAVSFQRPSERLLGVHLLLRNPAPNTCCVVDFTLTLLNRHHFSQNKVYTKRRAKFTITNPMQGVSRWMEMSELMEGRFSDETGEFLFELSLRNMTTIFECDIQLQQAALARYRQLLAGPPRQQAAESEPISLETTCFTFGAFDWSLTVVPLVLACRQPDAGSSLSLSSMATGAEREPVCRVYLNRQSGFNSLCRVRYRVILGHHQQPPAEFVDSHLLDQMSDAEGRIRGHQFRRTNLLKLISLRAAHKKPAGDSRCRDQQPAHLAELRVRVEMVCANPVSEALVPMRPPLADNQQPQSSGQVSNCLDRNKQAWCVEADTSEDQYLRLKLFFLDLATVPRNHLRYISWTAYLVRKLGARRDSSQVLHSPHSNFYLKDGMDMGIIMETDVAVSQLDQSYYLNSERKLTVHIEWVDSLLLFSHLYNNYDALASVQRHQLSRELAAIQLEYGQLERRYARSRRRLAKLRPPNQHQELDDQQSASSASSLDSDSELPAANGRPASSPATRWPAHLESSGAASCEPMNIPPPPPAGSQLRNQLETRRASATNAATSNELLPLHHQHPHHLLLLQQQQQQLDRFHLEQPTISRARSSVMEPTNWEHLAGATSNGHAQLHLAAGPALTCCDQVAPRQLPPQPAGRSRSPQPAGHLSAGR